MYCHQCGRAIDDTAAVCPHCGASQADRTPVKPRYNNLCILGFIASCISLIIDFRAIFAMAGIIASALGFLTCKSSGERGKNLAVWGMILGAVELIFTILWMGILYR